MITNPNISNLVLRSFYSKNIVFLKIYITLTYIIIGWLCPLTTFSSSFIDETTITQELQYIQQEEHTNIHRKTIINNLQSALYFISERKNSNIKIQEYQKIIDNFSYIALQLREEYNNVSDTIININHNLSADELKQRLLKINNQLMDLSEQLKQEQDQSNSINEELILLPQQQATTKNILNNLEKQQILYANINTPLEKSKFTALQAEQSARRLKIAELEFAQLSASNRKELSRLRIALLKKKYDHTNSKLHMLRNKLHHICQKETKEVIEHTEKILTQQNNALPKSIKQQLQKNRDLSVALSQQAHYMNDITTKKQEVILNTLQVKQTFSDLLEQAQWLDKSPILGETLRSQVSKLPKTPKSQQLDQDMAQLRTKRLQYEHQLNKLTTPLSSQHKQDDGTPFTLLQEQIFNTQIITQRNLITSLLNGYDTQILELTKLKVAYEQLKEALQDIQIATHRHLFWVADVTPVTISYPIDIFHDVQKLLIEDKINLQIISALKIIYNNQKTLISIILCTIMSIGLYFTTHHHYQEFLEQSNKKIGKVNQDNFSLTFHNIWSSILIASPIPILWVIIGYSLKQIWACPIVVALGEGISATTFMLWIFIVSAYFAAPKGLFITHFNWSTKRVQQVFSPYYICSISTIVFLTMTCIVFNNYNNREFSSTLGRLCFILLCIYLTFITNNLKYSGFPLYLNKHDSPNNIINSALWNIMICAPIIAAISCILGYLFAAQALLARLETSLFIWIALLIIYYIIRRWMFIQRRRIAFERAKQRRATLLALRTYNESNSFQSQTNNTSNYANNKKILDLDTISTQSLQLIRSILTIIALLFMTLLWSELRSAFSFLENITLWDVTSTIKGVENIQPITLNSFLIATLVIIITTKTVRNLPALLELTFLQHLDLTPGTGYAITTLTKYILMLLGSIIGCSLIGIEWSKIQWLIAALGVGLGFGLQEIFANFISGLMILFEKPIRIGDTITISSITGSVTRINTRATIITDWNNKEIIIPNKELITKQFINWSLSDTVTRVVIRVLTPLQIDTNKMTKFLLEVANNSPFALHNPSPEVYLADLQQGFPIFEIRIYTSDVKFRMPVCHKVHMSIMEYYKNNEIKIPYIQIWSNQPYNNNFDYNYSQANFHPYPIK